MAFLIAATCASAQCPVPYTPYCPPGGHDAWNKTNATESLEDLIHGQNALISDFESLLHKYSGEFSGQNNSTFMASFEDLLRKQTELHNRFASILGTGTTWNSSFNDPDTQALLLSSYGQMLCQEKQNYNSFLDLLNDTWCNKDFRDHSSCSNVDNSQMEFLYSFDDLMARQDALLTNYYNLTYGLNPGVATEDKVILVELFENLTRLHSLKLSELIDLMNNSCTKWP